ncbi:hypothetical protein MUO79_09405 [Candidatus Bathyarchaeota archaeon]|nr:hypothetical protein [Candidatus Bathyarchaeota archaeon]
MVTENIEGGIIYWFSARAEDVCSRYRDLQDLVGFKFVFPPYQFGQLDAVSLLQHRFEFDPFR